MRTVLIIDDESDYRMVLSEILQQNGWQVLQAENGEAGIQIARTHRPAVVLCDLLMSPSNGFQVCRTLRQFDSLRHTRIIIVSGRDFASDRQAAFDAGASEYLIKPFHADQLLTLLARYGGDGEPDKAGPDLDTAERQMPLRVRFWGVRGSVPTPGRTTLEYGGNTTCVEVRAAGQILILDAGTGLRPLGRELEREFADEPLDLTLLLTHTHWDHIQGIPFFLPVYRPQNHLRILGYEGARQGLNTVLASQMESPFFPIGLREVPSNINIEELKEMSFGVGSIQVQACFANHPGICVGYRLSAGGRSVAFFPDNEPRPAPGASEAAIAFAQRKNEELIEFLRDTDVLIMDTQYDTEEYKQHIGWGHGCVEAVVPLAIRAKVKQLFLFHHDPEHDDAKVADMTAQAKQLAAAQGSALQVEAAREGLTVDLASVRR